MRSEPRDPRDLRNDRYLATRDARHINLERLPGLAPSSPAEQAAYVVISGHGRAKSLAWEAAEGHFREHPARTRLVVVVVE